VGQGGLNWGFRERACRVKADAADSFPTQPGVRAGQGGKESMKPLVGKVELICGLCELCHGVREEAGRFPVKQPI